MSSVRDEINNEIKFFNDVAQTIDALIPKPKVVSNLIDQIVRDKVNDAITHYRDIFMEDNSFAFSEEEKQSLQDAFSGVISSFGVHNYNRGVVDGRWPR